MKNNKDWWRDEIKKVLDGESIYLTGTEKTEGMSKQEIIEWIVETVIEQEKEKNRKETLEEVNEIVMNTRFDEDKKDIGSGVIGVREEIMKLAKAVYFSGWDNAIDIVLLDLSKLSSKDNGKE